ncbi:type II toxin-antitoxin system VapC family toxin [uncultured Jatrophihabitans sp.]|uniref:type II toxin-antitoxin system VapC family toxin n=1 Tax=uncultured Jatrophihabitans sp. TaxID=1610747 RepID=UPI0035CB52F2
MTNLYVDTSALLKRVFIETESAQVRAILRSRNAAGDLLASSALAWVEVSRALLRAGVTDAGTALNTACSGIARQPLDSATLTRARTIGAAYLRSLDAIHLAAAITLGAVEILTFDQRLAEAAETVGVQAIP